MQAPARSRNETVDTSRRFSELYFGMSRLVLQPLSRYLTIHTQGYASNLSPLALKGRCPDSLFAGLARLDGWRWHINSTRYANIVESKDDVVYGGLYFLSPRDEAGLDESEGVPWLYEKK
jgi:gamma-glutamylcyclotransferase